MAGRLVSLGGSGHFFIRVKFYAVEIASTAVFVVFIVVETIRAIKHLIFSIFAN
jgi:hypothetical protein